MPSLWVLQGNPSRPGLSPTYHPSFSAKAPRLRELEVLDEDISLRNLVFGQDIVFRLIQKEGGWGRGYGMGRKRVAYEDDLLKNQG